MFSVPQLLSVMKEHLMFVSEYMQQMQRRLADKSIEPSERDMWHQSFQQTLSEHVNSIRRIDPSSSDTGRIEEALNSIPIDSNSSEMVTMMQQYSDFFISMVHKKMGEPKKWDCPL